MSGEIIAILAVGAALTRDPCPYTVDSMVPTRSAKARIWLLAPLTTSGGGSGTAATEHWIPAACNANARTWKSTLAGHQARPAPAKPPGGLG